MFTFLTNIAKKHIIIVIISIICAVYYPSLVEQYEKFTKSSQDRAASTEELQSRNLFTSESLARFNGESEDLPVYLSILGSVYDVSKGRRHYGKGCAYSFFSGRDASAAFITGNFDEYTPESDDVLQLKPSELLSLHNWKSFYDKDYIYKGNLIGRFYDENGEKTDYHLKFEALVNLAREQKSLEEQKKEEHPPCNIEWSADTNTRVWCTDQSGGKKRDWVGVPRKYFEPGQKSYRCACVRTEDLHASHFKEYDGCDSSAKECYYKID